MNEYLESLKELEIAIKHAESYKPRENTQQIKGLTDYSGGSTTDKVYPCLFNILISLNLQLLSKVNYLTTLVEDLKIKEPIEVSKTLTDDIEKELINKISKLNLGTDIPSTSSRQPETYKFWKPRK